MDFDMYCLIASGYTLSYYIHVMCVHTYMSHCVLHCAANYTRGCVLVVCQMPHVL